MIVEEFNCLPGGSLKRPRCPRPDPGREPTSGAESPQQFQNDAPRIAPPRSHSATRRSGPTASSASVASPSPKVALLLQQAVGRHLILRRRRDEKLAGRFVVWMVDDGQPLVRQVGPIHAENTAIPVAVLRTQHNPLAGVPRYFTVHCRHSPAFEGLASVMTSRSFWCT